MNIIVSALAVEPFILPKDGKSPLTLGALCKFLGVLPMLMEDTDKTAAFSQGYHGLEKSTYL